MLNHILRRVTTTGASSPDAVTGNFNSQATGVDGNALVSMVTSLLRYAPPQILYTDSFLCLLGELFNKSTISKY